VIVHGIEQPVTFFFLESYFGFLARRCGGHADDIHFFLFNIVFFFLICFALLGSNLAVVAGQLYNEHFALNTSSLAFISI
jgi:hypothetical protein